MTTNHWQAHCEMEARAVERERNPTAQQIWEELTAEERRRMKLDSEQEVQQSNS